MASFPPAQCKGPCDPHAFIYFTWLCIPHRFVAIAMQWLSIFIWRETLRAKEARDQRLEDRMEGAGGRHTEAHWTVSIRLWEKKNVYPNLTQAHGELTRLRAEVSGGRLTSL